MYIHTQIQIHIHIQIPISTLYEYIYICTHGSSSKINTLNGLFKNTAATKKCCLDTLFSARSDCNKHKVADQLGQVLSSLFCNIDGNATNFDEYLVELKRIGHSFDVLGLAETNIEPNLQGLYQIPNYVSF